VLPVRAAPAYVRRNRLCCRRPVALQPAVLPVRAAPAYVRRNRLRCRCGPHRPTRAAPAYVAAPAYSAPNGTLRTAARRC